MPLTSLSFRSDGQGWELVVAKVLVVDDDYDLADVCSQVLATEGYETNIARNGMDAIIAVKDEKADVVLLDASMPLLDGLSVCKMVKQNPATVRMPVIIMSASETLLKKAVDARADAVIAKPFDIDMLLETVGRFVQALE
jgi:DNA-binding response OmpR family regulator